MAASARVESLMLAFVGIALGAIGLLSSSVRGIALVASLASLAMTFIYLRSEETRARYDGLAHEQAVLAKDIRGMLAQMDIHKKIYNLE